MKIMLTCSLPYISSRTDWSTSAVCAAATSSAFRCFFASAGVGEDFPDEGAGGVLPGIFSPVFSTAFAAATFDPASGFEGVESSFVMGEAGFLGEAVGGVGTP